MLARGVVSATTTGTLESITARAVEAISGRLEGARRRIAKDPELATYLSFAHEALELGFRPVEFPLARFGAPVFAPTTFSHGQDPIYQIAFDPVKWREALRAARERLGGSAGNSTALAPS